MAEIKETKSSTESLTTNKNPNDTSHKGNFVKAEVDVKYHRSRESSKKNRSVNISTNHSAGPSGSPKK